MQKVIVRIDWYTKIVLTLIVVLLAGLLARPYVAGGPARGGYGDQPVYVTNKKDMPIPVSLEGYYNAVDVQNWPNFTNPMSVEIENEPIHIKGSVDINNRVLFVVDWKEREDYYEWLDEWLKGG